MALTYKQLLEIELRTLNIRIKNLMDWLMENPLAENFDTIYDNYTSLYYQQKAKKDALNRLNYPAIHRRQNATYIPQSI